MGFHTVATGYLLKKHGGLLDYIYIICKGFIDPKTWKIYKGNQMDKIIHEMQKNEEADCISDIEEKYDLILHDDIVKTGDDFVYKENEHIKVGQTHCCAVMIYISIVDDLDDGIYFFSDEELLQLMEWKKNLVQQGRISNDTFFASVPNCCS